MHSCLFTTECDSSSLFAGSADDAHVANDAHVSAADQPHAAHAAPGSLEAVMEAQNALLTERQQQPHLAVSQEELQTQRRKSVSACTCLL